jgi:UDP-N-acetylmuramoyl-L-alanyl-D-glutamate--2,6-diaminopimelate ligase
MLLMEILRGVTVVKLQSAMFGRMVLTQDVSVNAIRYDSRQVTPGDLFVALRGTAVDGHKFIMSAMNAGASVVVVDDDHAIPDTMFMHLNILKILVPDTRIALARMSANFYGHPASRMTMVGVTGTNGKTTTTHLVKSILEANSEKVGLLGTIEYTIGDTVVPATHTTPESLELHGLLDRMTKEQCTAAVMEVSSHALAMHRTDGIPYRAGIFTNLTQDHLDYHKTMDEYFRAKKILFDTLNPEAVAVVNADDPYGLKIAEGTKARVRSFGTLPNADYRAENIRLRVDGCSFTIATAEESTEIRSMLTGRFNVSNILAAFTAATAIGVPPGVAAEGIERLPAVRGRFEQITSPAGWTVVIDYAHSPDALENCLRTVREILPAGKGGRVITLFGCGGDRDRTKRPIMGRIAAELSDVVIVTSDNPRSEDPETIIREVRGGIPAGTRTEERVDRAEAIRLALDMARPGDVVLIAGKGHETYQIIGNTRIHFDDREEVRRSIGN